MNAPVVLDFDGSVDCPVNGLVIPLADWQERIRFGCSVSTLTRLAGQLDLLLPRQPGPVLLGSGDFHHLSLPLIERRQRDGRLQVVICDNHPDNMRFPWGIHCGSWVQKVSQLQNVDHVYVLGISSRDVAITHAWENHWRPLRSGRVSYWCLQADTGWAGCVGLGHAIRSFGTPEALLEAFENAIRDTNLPFYLSIDKDVLRKDVVQTNWDQGQLRVSHLQRVIALARGRIAGADICGEVSAYRYQTRWKRWLSRVDGQQLPTPALIAAARERHAAVNGHLIDCLSFT